MVHEAWLRVSGDDALAGRAERTPLNGSKARLAFGRFSGAWFKTEASKLLN